jgi:hypothetical protein
VGTPETAGRPGYLVVRRGGSLWGVASTAVTGLRRGPGGYRIALGAGAVVVDEVLGLAEGLAVRAPSPLVRRFWPEALCGIATYGGRPLVLIDPAAPPRALDLEEGELVDG